MKAQRIRLSEVERAIVVDALSEFVERLDEELKNAIDGDDRDFIVKLRNDTNTLIKRFE